jgi:Transglycosylase SLT domain
MRWLLLIVIGLTVALAASSGDATQVTAPQPSDQQQSDLCAAAVQKAEQQYGTPPGLLNAIAKAESGRRIDGASTLQPWPWTLNADGQGVFFATKEKAVAGILRALTHGSLYTDIGCMQVDLQFHPKAFHTLEEALDPVANADYAARFLVGLHEATGGNWFAAVGLYHSRSPELARLYREHVTAAGLGISPGRPGSGKLRLALAGGGTLVINLNRQPSRGRRQMSACQVATILRPYLRSSARAQACAAAP